MKRWIKSVWLRAIRDWWTVTEKNGKWGIYHPTRHHFWGHPYETETEAQKECDRRNKY